MGTGIPTKQPLLARCQLAFPENDFDCDDTSADISPDADEICGILGQ